MKSRLLPPAIVLAILLPWTLIGQSAATRQETGLPRFRVQEIETTLGVGYAVLLVDLNGDGKKDIVVADTQRVLWYENPTWKRRTIIQGKTKPDNVCIDAYDIDGDGRLDLALGAGWKGLDSRAEGTIQWLRRGKTLDQPWTVYPIGTEPVVHRMRFADIDGTGKPRLIVCPLLGRDSSPRDNWMDVPVRILAYQIPRDPARDRWVPEVLTDKLHVAHNFYPIPAAHRKGMDLLVASYEGVSLLSPNARGHWQPRQIGAGNQSNPKDRRGASEVKQGKLKNGKRFIATIEPWHGHQAVVYTPPEDPRELWHRHVIDDQLRWGHAVWCADIDGDGDDEVIIGVRDDLSSKPGERRGVRVYKAVDGRGAKWVRTIIDDGGIAVEDMAAADLNGDGRPDIVAVGRQTHNIRIYWNEGGKK